MEKPPFERPQHQQKISASGNCCKSWKERPRYFDLRSQAHPTELQTAPGCGKHPEAAKALLAAEEKEAAWLEKEACWLAEKESLVVKMREVRLESFTKGYARGDREMKEFIRDVDPDFNFQKMVELGQQR